MKYANINLKLYKVAHEEELKQWFIIKLFPPRNIMNSLTIIINPL
jgi:hypothetical protein